MVLYKCERCLKEFKKKYAYHIHQNRKNKCVKVDEREHDESIEKMNHFEPPLNRKIKIEPKLNLFEPENIHELNHFEPELNHFEPELNHFEPDVKIRKYICKFCKKQFTTNSHMRRHEKNCKEKTNELTVVKESIKDELREELRKEFMEEMRITNITNNNNNTNNTNTDNSQNSHNVTNNIINVYGKENVSHINYEWIHKLIRNHSPRDIIQCLVKDIHCNPDNMENMNMFMPNKKSRQIVMVFSDKRVPDGSWETANRIKTIVGVIDDKIEMLKKVDIFREEFTEEDREKFYDVLIENDTEGSKIKKEWIEDISMALYDNKTCM